MTFAELGDHLAIALPGGTALFTTRRGGVSDGPYQSLNLGLWTDDERDRVAENRARVERISGGRLAQARQVHGTDVIEANPGHVAEADGQVTARRGVAAMALTADCLPIALARANGDRPAVGVLHAGRIGLLAGIVEAGVDALGGARLVAAIGPCIGACCYEVGDDVAAAYRARFGATVLRGRNLDLRRAAEQALLASGVERVDHVDLCTACHADRFFSYRRDGEPRGGQGVIAYVS
jgi:polyphenol oxidase